MMLFKPEHFNYAHPGDMHGECMAATANRIFNRWLDDQEIWSTINSIMDMDEATIRKHKDHSTARYKFKLVCIEPIAEES